MEVLGMAGGWLLTVFLGTTGLWLAAKELRKNFSGKTAIIMAAIQMVLLMILYFVCGKESFEILKYLMMVTVLEICAWTDWKEHLILNRILLMALIIRLLLTAGEFLYYGIEEWRFMVISAAIAAMMFLLAALLCKAVAPQGVGFGDIKLLFVFGLYAGTDMGIQIIFITFVILFAAAVYLLITKKATRKSVIPFAPFLYAGAVISVIMLGI